MPTDAHRIPKPYTGPATRRMPGYKVSALNEYALSRGGPSCTHLRIVKLPSSDNDEKLRKLLHELKDHPVSGRLRQGQESEFLHSQSTVQGLATTIRDAPSASAMVERHLDELFDNFIRGQWFEESAQVIVLLYAAKRAGVSWFTGIAESFASSTASEIGWIRQYAKHLLR
jgi:hypothetical protein